MPTLFCRTIGLMVRSGFRDYEEEKLCSPAWKEPRVHHKVHPCKLRLRIYQSFFLYVSTLFR